MNFKIKRIDENNYEIVYPNKTVYIHSDNGSAADIVDTILSPRSDMTLSEYLNADRDEVTQVIDLGTIAA